MTYRNTSQNSQIKGMPTIINNVNPSKKYVPFNNSHLGNITSREAGLMVRDMVEAYENKLK